MSVSAASVSDAQNQNQRPSLEGLLAFVVSDRQLHAKWINTFSLLESIGFRKIIKSHKAQELTTEVLQHAFEESRHALLLKKLAVRVGGLGFDTFEPDHLFCGDSAVSYFQTLDAVCARELGSAKLCYLYVTWLVEVRALQVYEAHRAAAAKGDAACQGVATQLARLLREEESHLDEVEVSLRVLDPEFEMRGAEFQKVERLLFATFLEQAQNTVAHALA